MDGMVDDLLFEMADWKRQWKPETVVAIMAEAERQGYPVESGSYLKDMTISQLDRLLKGQYDA